MKDKTKRTIKYCMSLLIIIVLSITTIFCINQKLDVKESETRFGNFVENADDCEVLFFGSSTVIAGILPMEMYREYGISSYNMGAWQQTIASDYWQMINALEYASPKVIVLDCMGLSTDKKVSGNSNFLHNTFGYLPLSINKVKAIFDLTDDGDSLDASGFDYKKHRLEYIFSFGKYHGRWNELSEEDFGQRGENHQRGAELEREVRVSSYGVVPSATTLESETVSTTYLRKFIDEAKSRGIEVVLVYMPQEVDDEIKLAEAGTARQIAQEKEVPFISYIETKGIIDFRTDPMDYALHINASGAKKVTKNLGQFLKENYELTDYREMDGSTWPQEYGIYKSEKLEQIKSETELLNQLMLLSDKDFSTRVYLSENSKVYADKELVQMIINILPGVAAENFAEAYQNGMEYMYYANTAEGKISDQLEPGFESVGLASPVDILIQVYDNDTGEMVLNQAWSYGVKTSFIKVE